VPSILAPWKRIEKKGNGEAAFNIELVELVRADIRAASKANAMGGKRKNIPSFTESILSLQEQESSTLPLSDRQLAALPRTIFTAGFNHSLHDRTCLLAPITHPSILKTAQAELETLLPATASPAYKFRSPSFAESPAFPTSKP
jgi:hypothetical protein